MLIPLHSIELDPSRWRQNQASFFGNPERMRIFSIIGTNHITLLQANCNWRFSGLRIKAIKITIKVTIHYNRQIRKSSHKSIKKKGALIWVARGTPTSLVNSLAKIGFVDFVRGTVEVANADEREGIVIGVPVACRASIIPLNGYSRLLRSVVVPRRSGPERAPHSLASRHRQPAKKPTRRVKEAKRENNRKIQPSEGERAPDYITVAH